MANPTLTCHSKIANEDDQCEELHKPLTCIFAYQARIIYYVLPNILTVSVTATTCDYSQLADTKEGSDECTYNMAMAK